MNDEFMLWRKRRTLRWLSLSLAARGAAEGIAVALDARGEFSLGRIGLRGLAGLLGRPWTEVEPAVAELLETETYHFDAERLVISDPQHPERQSRSTDHRPSDPDHSTDHPDHRPSDPPRPDPRQLALFGSPEAARIISTDDPSSSSDQMIQERREKTDHPGTLTPTDADAPPVWASRIYDQVHTVRPDLPPFGFVWPKFVEWVVDRRKSYASRSGLQKRYREFLVFEKPLPSPEAPPMSEARPVERSPNRVPSPEETDRAIRVREREEEEVSLIPIEERIAIARLAMGAFDAPSSRAEPPPSRVHRPVEPSTLALVAERSTGILAALSSIDSEPPIPRSMSA